MVSNDLDRVQCDMRAETSEQVRDVRQEADEKFQAAHVQIEAAKASSAAAVAVAEDLRVVVEDNNAKVNSHLALVKNQPSREEVTEALALRDAEIAALQLAVSESQAVSVPPAQVAANAKSLDDLKARFLLTTIPTPPPLLAARELVKNS